MFYTQGLNFYIPFAVTLILMITFLFFAIRHYKNKSYKDKLLPIKLAFYALITLEVIKITLLIQQNGGLAPLRFPIVFCSLAMYAFPLYCFKETKLANVGKAFSIFPSLIAGLMFFILPNTLSFDTPIIAFVTCHSFFYHGLIFIIAIYMIAVKVYDFPFKDHIAIFLALVAYLFFAVILSIFIGGNISLFGPDSAYLGIIYKLVGYLPGNLLLVLLCYFLSFVFYKIIDIRRKGKKQKNSL